MKPSYSQPDSPEACRECGFPVGACECTTNYDVEAHRTEITWERDGGEGLPFPETDSDGKVWLFTCIACGRRWADPPAPVSGCACGSEDIVVHRFDRETYWNIRSHGDPEPEVTES